MSVDVVGDFLTAIRNALMVYKRFVVVRSSKLKVAILQVLKDEGFIRDFEKIEDDKGHHYLKVFLKYVDGISAISEIKRVSRPGRRCYSRSRNITPVIGGLGVSILSTSSGIVTDRQAKKLSIGGEVICHIW